MTWNQDYADSQIELNAVVSRDCHGPSWAARQLLDVRTIDVALPRLDPDSPDTCPVPYGEVLEHVTTEFDDGTRKQLTLTFLRTARVGATSYWIWKFNDPGRGDGYVLVSFWPPDVAATECDDTFDMTPEQFIVASHFKIEP